MRQITVFCVTLAVLAMVVPSPSALQAKPLSTDECTARLAEHTDLLSKGASSTAEKEPDWVKTNMSETDLARVKRLIQVEDDIRFRCLDVVVAGVTPGQLIGKKADDPDEAEGDKDSDTQTASKAGKPVTKPVESISGQDIPLPLRKPSPPKRAEALRLNLYGHN